jgi:hypothetical protein
MTVERTREVTDAIAAYRAVGDTFRAAVSDGAHGLAEYEQWKDARNRAETAQGRIVSAFEEAERAKVDECNELVKEEGRIRGVITETGGRDPRIPAWHAAWLQRASAYAGRVVGDLDASLIRLPPLPKGEDRPWPLGLAPVPPYESELRRLADGATRH